MRRVVRWCIDISLASRQIGRRATSTKVGSLPTAAGESCDCAPVCRAARWRGTPRNRDPRGVGDGGVPRAGPRPAGSVRDAMAGRRWRTGSILLALAVVGSGATRTSLTARAVP
jgi:hypothetical protein